jgi:hypothetical protein
MNHKIHKCDDMPDNRLIMYTNCVVWEIKFDRPFTDTGTVRRLSSYNHCPYCGLRLTKDGEAKP